MSGVGLSGIESPPGPQKQRQLLFAPRMCNRLFRMNKTERMQDSDHRHIARSGGREDIGRGHACQQQPAEVHGNVIPPMLWSDEYPAKLEQVIRGASGYAGLRENGITMLTGGHLECCDCPERGICHVVIRKNICVTNATLQPLIRTLKAEANKMRKRLALVVGAGARFLELRRMTHVSTRYPVTCPFFHGAPSQNPS